MRDLCTHCFRSQAFCLCADVKLVPSRTGFVLLQHPLERKKSIGTARLTHLSLPNSRIITGVHFDEHPAVQQILSDRQNECFVLYPSERSYNLSEGPPEAMRLAQGSGRKVVIFVIDGTWACAKKMLNQSRSVADLPSLSFDSDRISEYEIRRQPRSYCLSTVEAVHRVLELLEPEIDAQSLVSLFRDLVKQQKNFGGIGKLRRVDRAQ